MTSTQTCDWQGASGRSYTYWVYPLPPNFDPAPGNYIFAKLNAAGHWEPVYIGQTGDLSDRFDDHHAVGCIHRNGATHIHAHKNNSKTDREAEESDLLARYPTYCNVAA